MYEVGDPDAALSVWVQSIREYCQSRFSLLDNLRHKLSCEPRGPSHGLRQASDRATLLRVQASVIEIQLPPHVPRSLRDISSRMTGCHFELRFWGGR